MIQTATQISQQQRPSLRRPSLRRRFGRERRVSHPRHQHWTEALASASGGRIAVLHQLVRGACVEAALAYDITPGVTLTLRYGREVRQRLLLRQELRPPSPGHCNTARAISDAPMSTHSRTTQPARTARIYTHT